MGEKHEIKLVATDLDGTLLKNDKLISEKDWNTLLKMEEQNIIRVAATGRSMFKVDEVLPKNSPFDYIVFSSGAGVFDWQKRVILKKEILDDVLSNTIVSHLLGNDCNFIVFDAIPNNNTFRFHRGGDSCREFEGYIRRHKNDCSELKGNEKITNAGQMLVIIPNNEELFEKLKQEILSDCMGVRVIRATSPVNGKYIWLEIFPETVSKGEGIRFICNELKIPFDATIGIGNDYNDTDMFDVVCRSFVVENSPQRLKDNYETLLSTNNESPLTETIEKLGLFH